MTNLPPYDGPLNPVPQVTPLTYRDGVTMLKKLDDLKRYINRALVPFVNKTFSSLDAAFEAQVNAMITAVNDAIEEIVNSAITVQDPVVSGILANNASATRTTLNNILAGYYTEVEANNLFETKTDATTKANARYTKAEVDAIVDALELQIAAIGPIINAINGRVDLLELLAASGRLSQTSLDTRYVRVKETPLAIIMGSSNATESTLWPQELATMMGWQTPKNFAIGGGAFTSNGSSNFAYQLANALSDSSINKAEVDYVIIADCGNDIRSLVNAATFKAAVTPVLASARSNYPNARIIIVPSLWGIATDNLNTGRIMWNQLLTQVLRDEALLVDAEVIENTWLWHYDSTAWMLPNEVHYTAAGNTRVAQNIRKYLHGVDINNSIGWTNVVNAPNVNAGGVYAARIDNQVHIFGEYITSSVLGQDISLFTLPEGIFPLANMRVPVIMPNRLTDQSIDVFGPGASRGLVRSFSSTGSGSHYITAVLPAF